MINPVVLADSPNKPNIKYSVVRNPGTLEETFESLIEEVRKNRLLTERTIIFCRTYDSCARIYMFMKYQLRHESTEPIGAPDIGQFRLVNQGGNSWGGWAGHSPPNFWPTTLFGFWGGFHTPMTERYHQKWC